MAAASYFTTVYKEVDGLQIDVDVYLPPPRDVKCPVLINIHGGVFMLGSSKMVNQDQIRDCLQRGWVVLAPNHRLCPQVNLLEGPMQDCRDLLAWVYEGTLSKVIQDKVGSDVTLDLDHVFSFGTSSGGTLALSLGFGVPRPVAGIYDMYGACNFSDSFWTTKLAAMKLPEGLSESFLNKIYEGPVPITGGVSLEGQATGPPDFTDPRQAFALTQIASGTVLKAILPSQEWETVDPVLNIDASFPPTFIVHGTADTKVPIGLSRELFERLKGKGVQSGMQEIPGEEHTFAAKMEVGSETWNLQRRGFDFLEALIK